MSTPIARPDMAPMDWQVQPQAPVPAQAHSRAPSRAPDRSPDRAWATARSTQPAAETGDVRPVVATGSPARQAPHRGGTVFTPSRSAAPQAARASCQAASSDKLAGLHRLFTADDGRLGRGEVDALAAFYAGCSRSDQQALREELLDLYHGSRYEDGQRSFFRSCLLRAGLSRWELDR